MTLKGVINSFSSVFLLQSNLMYLFLLWFNDPFNKVFP